MRFRYTILFVTDVAASLDFYERAFGVARRWMHESGTYGELDTGSTTLSFVNREFAKSNGTPAVASLPIGQSPAVLIGFATEDVAKAYAKACESGAEGLAPPTLKPWGQTVAYVRDTEGYLVELGTPVGE